MKNLYIFSFLMIAALGMTAQDSASVIFAIDMNGVSSVSADGVSLAGNLQDNFAGTACNEWTPGCTILSDDDADGVWTIKLKVAVGTYEYKYVNGIAWGNNEGGGLSADCGVDDMNGAFNRTLDLTSAPLDRDTIIGPFKYDSCTLSTLQVTSLDRGFESAMAMTVAPNPANSSAVLSFKNDRAHEFTMTLSTMTGAVVRRESVTGSSVEIQRNDLPAGLYFVTLVNNEGQRASRKMIFR